MKFFKDQRGQAMSEYALILALIAIVAIGAIALFGDNVLALFTEANDAISDTSS